MRVPSVARQVPPEPPKILPEGEYDAVIERVDEPIALKSRMGMFRVPFVLRVEGQLVFVQYSGFADTAVMIYRNRNVWIGTTYKVKIKTVEYEGCQFNDARILWEQV